MHQFFSFTAFPPSIFLSYLSYLSQSQLTLSFSHSLSVFLVSSLSRLISPLSVPFCLMSSFPAVKLKNEAISEDDIQGRVRVAGSLVQWLDFCITRTSVSSSLPSLFSAFPLPFFPSCSLLHPLSLSLSFSHSLSLYIYRIFLEVSFQDHKLIILNYAIMPMHEGD